MTLARLRLAAGPKGKRLATMIVRFLEQRRDGNLQDSGERFQPFVACLAGRHDAVGELDRTRIEAAIERFHVARAAQRGEPH